MPLSVCVLSETKFYNVDIRFPLKIIKEANPVISDKILDWLPNDSLLCGKRPAANAGWILRTTHYEQKIWQILKFNTKHHLLKICELVQKTY